MNEHDREVFELAKELMGICERHCVQTGIEALVRVMAWAFLCVVADEGGDHNAAMDQMVRFCQRTAETVRRQQCHLNEDLNGKPFLGTSVN